VPLPDVVDHHRHRPLRKHLVSRDVGHTFSGQVFGNAPEIPAAHPGPRQAAQRRMLNPKVFQVSSARGDATSKLGVRGLRAIGSELAMYLAGQIVAG
jgi:hypothetical protein